MDNTARGTGRQTDNTPQSQSSSPPNVMSKSTNISQSGSHRATTGQTLQAKPSSAAMASRKEPSVERLDNVAGASGSPGAASRSRVPRSTDDQTAVHPAEASKGRQATTDVKKPPLDAYNTQNVSANTISPSKSSSISASKQPGAAQREGIPNSGSTVSAPSSTQPPAHSVANSSSSRDAQPSRANGNNTSPPVVAPGPDETRKKNEPPRPQEDPRSQRSVTRPHTEQVESPASTQSSTKPSSYPPPVSSSERNATRPQADPVNRTASSSVQSSTKPSTTYSPPLSSSERNATRPKPEPVNPTASVQPPAKPATSLPSLDRATASISPSSSSPAPTPSKPLVPTKHTSGTTDPPSNSLSQPVSGPGDLYGSKSGIQGNEGVDHRVEQGTEGSPSAREERNRVPAPARENRLKDSTSIGPNPTASHEHNVHKHPAEISVQRTSSSYQSRGSGPGAPRPPKTNDSQQPQTSGHAAEKSASKKPSVHNFYPQSATTSPGRHFASNPSPPYVYMGAAPVPEPEEESSSGSSSSEELNEPVPVWSVPMERHTPKGIPRDPDRPDRPQVVDSFDNARTLLAQPLFTSLSPSDAGRSTVSKGDASQRAGSGDTANSASEGMRPEISRKHSGRNESTPPTSPEPATKQNHDDDKNPSRRPSLKTGKAVERDGQTRRPPPSTERIQPNQSMSPLQTGQENQSGGTESETKETLSQQQPPFISCCNITCIIC